MRLQNILKNEIGIDDLYYDAMDLLGGSRSDAKKAEQLLLKALSKNEHSVQTHVGLTCVYGYLSKRKKVDEHVAKAYEETVKKFPAWPKRLEWGYLEHRQYLRAIQARADLYADDGEKEKAKKLYRLLLKMNPNDNQGVRYLIAGLYAGVSGEKVNQMFDEGNQKQNWDKLERLVKTQNAKYKFWKEPKD